MRPERVRRTSSRTVASTFETIVLLATGATAASALPLPEGACFLGPPPQAVEPFGTLVASGTSPLVGTIGGDVYMEVYREPRGTLAFLYSFYAESVLPPAEFTSFWLDIGGFTGWTTDAFLLGEPDPFGGGLCRLTGGEFIRVYAEQEQQRDQTSLAYAWSPGFLIRTNARQWTTVAATAGTHPGGEGHAWAYAPAVAPEPSTLALLVPGVVAIGTLAGRRRAGGRRRLTGGRGGTDASGE